MPDDERHDRRRVVALVLGLLLLGGLIGAIVVLLVNDDGSWAGTSYETPNFASAALLKAQGNSWVNVDRAANCGDASIPVDVHHFCEVS